jgi:hypothetical protein
VRAIRMRNWFEQARWFSKRFREYKVRTGGEAGFDWDIDRRQALLGCPAKFGVLYPKIGFDVVRGRLERENGNIVRSYTTSALIGERTFGTAR